MKNVIIIIVLVAVLVGTIGFASVMYNSLKDAVMDDSLPQRQCPQCGKLHDFDYPQCPFCGYGGQK